MDIKKGAKRIYLAELIWTVNQSFKLNLKIPDLFKTNHFRTIYGNFFITPDLVSTITVSPAFERLDINFLLNLMNKHIQKKEKLLFIDIGANFGLYSVLVGNFFKNKVDIISFEPNTTYLTSPSFAFLKKNISKNKIKNIKLYKIGIGSRDTKTKNEAGFITKKLSTILGISYFKKYDTVFIKLDVDDFVLDALRGIELSVKNSKKTILLVEDFVDKKSIIYLSKHFDFISKRSTYNSFWSRN